MGEKWNQNNGKGRISEKKGKEFSDTREQRHRET